MTETPHDSLIERMLGPAEPEILCDECFEKIDQYVDTELRGEDPDGAFPGMRPHLEGCPACAEEYESLKQLAARDAP